MRPIRIDLPVPFALNTVNAWLFPGSEAALVDCGIKTRPSYQGLIDGIRAAGVDPRDLRLYITHGHVDHAGNARALHDDYGVQLIAPRADAGYVETFRRDAVPRNDEFADALRAHGVPEEKVVAMRADTDAIDRYLDDCPIHADLADGTRMALGDTEATAVRTPGHTPGSVCYWLTEDNALLTGDTLLRTITSNAVELRDADRGNYHAYMQSMEGLRRFIGCEALPGHRKPFPLTDDAIDYHVEHHERRRARILEGLETPRTAYQLFPRVFPGLDSLPALFMGMAEIVGHLHSLEIDGLVRHTESEGRRVYSTHK